MSDSATDLIELDRKYQVHPLHHPSEHQSPIIYVRGKGSVVEDIHGRTYLDGLAGLWNVNVGHGRAELAEAAAAQMRELAYFSSYAGSSNIPAIKLATKLVELASGNMEAAFLTSGGAEANESAFKTARFYWKAHGLPDKIKVIARHHGYHGVTLQAMSATSMGAYWKMFEPRVPGFVHIQPAHPYRFVGGTNGETIGEAAARELEQTILREGPNTVAAFIGEPIHGAGGVFYPAEDYWRHVREVCNRHNVLLIADEIITGFGRTGRWFALEHWNVQPDILSFAKGVTSGYLPLGGIIVSKAIKRTLDSVDPENRWMHAFTYSSHPTCCAVALRNIEIIEREGLCANAAQMGERLYRGLVDALRSHANVGDIRGGKGLLSAVEFVEDRATKRNFPVEQKFAARLQAEMAARGVITRTRPSAGAHPAPGDAVFFAPPLVITEPEIDRLVCATAEAVHAILRG
jgi:adenosylmethionine-8-amino-7-oxononanoate aminotransferase